MSVFNVCIHIGSFNINIKINKDVKIRYNNIGKKFEHEDRIKEAIENGVDIPVNYNDFNNLF